MTTTKTTIELLERDEAEAAQRLLDGALKRNGLTRAALRDALEAGYSKVLEREHPTVWRALTPRDQAVQAAGRLILRIARECGLPLEAPVGASAMSVLREMVE